MKATRWQEAVALGGALLVLAACAALPLAFLAAEAKATAVATVLSGHAVWRLLLRSLLLSSAVTLAALAIGVPMGVLLGRTDVPGRRAGLVLHAFPMFLPPFLLALGWFHVVGGRLFNVAGAVAILGLTFAPVVTAMTALGLDGIDPSLEEAARVAAPRFTVMARILLPLARRSIALGGLVVFVLAFSELGVPMFLRVPVYPAAVFARLGGIAYAPAEAVALVLPLVGISLLVMLLERALGGRLSIVAMGLRRDRPPIPLGGARLAAAALVWAITLLGLVPLAALAVRAGHGGFTAAGRWMGDSLRNGLVDGAVAATVITAVGLVAGHALARGGRLARGMDGLTVLTFVMPAAVLGVGLIAAWNRPATLAVYGSAAIVVVGYVARYAVIGLRPLAAAIARSSLHLEDAAAVAGAGYWRRLALIVAPLHARALLGTWLLALVFCLRDLETAVLFYPPGGETLPVRIFTLEANGPPAAVAALAVWHVGVTAAVLSLGLAILPRGRR